MMDLWMISKDFVGSRKGSLVISTTLEKTQILSADRIQWTNPPHGEPHPADREIAQGQLNKAAGVVAALVSISEVFARVGVVGRKPSITRACPRKGKKHWISKKENDVHVSVVS